MMNLPMDFHLGWPLTSLWVLLAIIRAGLVIATGVVLLIPAATVWREHRHGGRPQKQGETA
jgi:hypothetical protein